MDSSSTIGIIGTGPTAENWARTAALLGGRGLSVTGRWPDAAVALTALQRHAATRTPAVDLLLLCIPGGEASRLIPELAGLARGVMLQPDAARNGEDAARFQRLVKKAGLAGFVANTLCFAPAFARVLELATAGCLGTLREAALVLEGEAPELPRPLKMNGLALLRAGGGAPATRLEWRQNPGGETAAAFTLSGSAGFAAARLPAAGTPPPVQFGDASGTRREFPAPASDPAALCLAAALVCLRRGETLSLFDLKSYAEILKSHP